jgi:ATP-dependent helicase/DNAse subunit B
MPMRFDDPAVSRKFFGDDMRISPSRVEVYHQCRFAYFCQYGLRAKPRKPADFDALAFGTLAHYVMEELVPTYTETGFDKIHRPQVVEDIRKVFGDTSKLKANAPSTIKKKGRNEPLVDSGEMRRRVNFRVEG